MTNNQVTTVQPKTVEKMMENKDVKKKFQDVLGSKANGFIASLITASKNDLKDVEPGSILKSAMTAATLDLPIEQNLGFAYLVPYNKKAQFQLGYKGYIQLAIRSGQYKTINAIAVYEGEIKKVNRLTGEFELNENEDEINRENIVGYMAYFKLVNGFEKALYMSKEEMEAHAKKYSKSYTHGKNSLWKTDFDSMGIKTILKRLISKYGIMSVDMQTAILSDNSVDEDSNLYQNNNFDTNKKTLDIVDIANENDVIDVESTIVDDTVETDSNVGDRECPF